jgi:antitoxin component YwqK of YwqJK toxin-antitoxin module
MAYQNYTKGQLDEKCIYFKENGDTLKKELYQNGQLIESKI